MVIDELESCGEAFPNSTFVGCIWKTKEYDKFKRIKGNRVVKNVKKVKESIAKIGFRRIPIIVNANMEKIDGQNRYAACEELGLPIEFVIDRDADSSVCARLNSCSKNWNTIDFINNYAENGNKNYQAIQKAVHNSNGVVSITTISTIADGDNGIISGNKTENVKSGNIYIKDFEEFMHTVDEFKEFFDTAKKSLSIVNRKPGRQEDWYTAFTIIRYYKGDMKRMINKMRTADIEILNKFQKGNAGSILLLLDTIYNYRCKKKISFYDRYNADNPMNKL